MADSPETPVPTVWISRSWGSVPRLQDLAGKGLGMSWSEDDELRFSIQDAMRGVKVPTLKVRLGEEDRAKLAQAVLERFKLSGYRIIRPNPKPFSTHGS